MSINMIGKGKLVARSLSGALSWINLFARSTVSNICVRIVFFYALFIEWPILAIFRSGRPEYVASLRRNIGAMLAIYCKLNRVSVEVIGTLPKEPCLILANHQSEIDLWLLEYYLDYPIMVGKRFLGRLFFFSKGLGMIYIDRKSPSSFVAMTRAVKRAIEKGNNVLVFPEGTRMPADQEIRLKPGVAGLYSANVCDKFVPLYINSGQTWGCDFSYIKRPAKIVIDIMPPILFSDSMRAKEFAQLVEDNLNEARSRH